MESAQGVYTVSGHLREEAAVKAELEKSNFDLKMRVFYLEEKLTRLAGSEGTAGLFSSGGGDGDSAMNALRLQVEEKNIELEQRNVLLTKAKTAIEALKREIERNKAEHSRQQDLEDRVRRLKQASDEMEAEFKQQTAQLEGQLQQSRQASLAKDQATAELESKVSSLELGLQQCRERLSDAGLEKDRLEETCLHARHRAEEMEEELLQLRAHCDLYSMRGDERAAEFDAMKTQLRSTELEHKFRVDEALSHHKVEIATLKQLHQQELDRRLQEARNTAREEADIARQQAEAALRETRAHDVKEGAHERAQLNLRIDDLVKRSDDKQLEIRELNEEIRTMRAHYDADRSRAEQALRDAEVSRVEAKLHLEQIDSLRKALEEAQEELRHLRKTHEHGAETKEGFRREQIEKNQLVQKLAQREDEAETMREALHSKEIKVLHDEAELRRLHALVDDLRTRTANQEEIVRENERTKADNHTLRTELQESNHKISHTSHDLAVAQGDLDHAKRTMTQMDLEIKKLQDMYDSISSHKEDLHFKEDRSKHSHTEAALHEQQQIFEAKFLEQKQAHEMMLREHKAQMDLFVDSHKGHSETHIGESRALIASLRLEIEHLNKDKLEHERQLGFLGKDKVLVERDAAEAREKTAQLREDIAKVLAAVSRSLSSWDETLLTVLEGNMHIIVPAMVGMHPHSHAHKTSFFQSAERALPKREQRADAHVFVHHADGASARVDDLMQDVAIASDRVQVKVDRCSKLRSVFDMQAQRLFEASQASLDAAADRASMMQHRLSVAVGRSESLAQVLERDAKKRQRDEDDMRAFRADVLAEHAAKAAMAEAAEHRARDCQASLAALQRKYDDSEETSQALMRQLEEVREELMGYSAAESVVSELSLRLSDLAEGNQALRRQVEEREQTVEDKSLRIEEVLLERAALEQHAERLQALVREREAALRDSHAKCAALLAEVDRLGQRQMPHSLAAVILETQSMLQGGSAGPGLGGSGSPEIGKLTRAALDIDMWGSQQSHPSPTYAQQQQQQQLQQGLRDGADAAPSSSSSSSSSSTSSSSNNGSGGSNEGRFYPTSSSASAPNAAALRTQTNHARRQVNFAQSPQPAPQEPRDVPLSFRVATPAAVRRPGSLTTGSGHGLFHSMLSPRAGGSGPGSPALSSPAGSHAHPSPGPAGVTPNTYARASVSRLGKLGSDLEALARKLDQFDVARK